MIETHFCEWRSDGAWKDPDTILYEVQDRRILFHALPFKWKDEIKRMKGSKWHGSDPQDGRKLWSISNCPRNLLQLEFLQGKNIYEHFEQPIRECLFRRYDLNGVPKKLNAHQIEMANICLTRHCQIIAAAMRARKTLAAQMVMEHGNASRWWWVGPKRTLENIKREFKQWDFRGEVIGPNDTSLDRVSVEFLSYEALVSRMQLRKSTDPIPQGVVFDESSRLKTPTSQRTIAAQELADLVRSTYPLEELYILLLSGTPNPRPLDIWSQAEIAWPGFLAEGSTAALEKRLAYLELKQHDDGNFMTRLGWRDDEKKCHVCGEYQEQHAQGSAPGHGAINRAQAVVCPPAHNFVPSVNEVAKLGDRLEGLMWVKHLKDCFDMPAVSYEKIQCPPSASLMRVAKAIVAQAERAADAAVMLRELSDGFQYKEEQDGTDPCRACRGGQLVAAYDGDGQAIKGDCHLCGGTCRSPRIVRVAREVACPKDGALLDLLDQSEETGRILVFAGFTGSIDRIVKLCQKRGWDVARCDGRGFTVFTAQGRQINDPPLDYWADRSNARVAFVAHPESGGMSFTLTEARACVFWSNSFKPEYRVQAAARFISPENVGCTVYDLIHLPSDERVLDVITENRRLELMTLGEFAGSLAV